MYGHYHTALLMLCALSATASAAPLAAESPDVHLSTTLTKAPDETRGQRIYELHCQRCHQADGGGSAAQKVPALAGQRYEYLIKQVVDFLDQERPNASMHQQLARGGINNATSIADVVGYVANLPRNPAPQQGAGTNVAQGKTIFQTDCVSCHGRSAEGNGDLWVPSLRGQHYGYLLEQMQQMARAGRGNLSEDLHRMFASYSSEEFQAMADYLSRFSP